MVSVTNGSGVPSCAPGLEPDHRLWSGLLPGPHIQQGKKEGIKVHILRIDYVAIRGELRYLIGVRNVVI
jgi:hypothetical protein